MIVDEELGRLLLAKLLERICPEDVAHQAVGGRFAKTIDLAPVSLDADACRRISRS